jgi:hypothetical protein
MKGYLIKLASYPHGLKTSYRSLQSFRWRENSMPFFKSARQIFCLSYFDLYLPPHCRCTRLCCTWLYLLTHTHSVDSSGRGIGPKQETYTWQNTTHTMSPERFEITIPASERPQTQAIDRAATGIGTLTVTFTKDRRIQSVPSNPTFWYPFQYYSPMYAVVSNCPLIKLTGLLLSELHIRQWTLPKRFSSLGRKSLNQLRSHFAPWSVDVCNVLRYVNGIFSVR